MSFKILFRSKNYKKFKIKTQICQNVKNEISVFEVSVNALRVISHVPQRLFHEHYVKCEGKGHEAGHDDSDGQ